MFQIQVFLNPMCPDLLCKLYYLDCSGSSENLPVGREASSHCQDWNHCGKEGTSASLPPGGWTVTRVWTITAGGCKDY